MKHEDYTSFTMKVLLKFQTIILLVYQSSWNRENDYIVWNYKFGIQVTKFILLNSGTRRHKWYNFSLVFNNEINFICILFSSRFQKMTEREKSDHNKSDSGPPSKRAKMDEPSASTGSSMLLIQVINISL